MANEVVNKIRALLYGGDEAPAYAPEGMLERKGLSVEKFARAIGVTRTSVYNYINDKKRPTTETLRRISEALELPFEEMLTFCTPSKVGHPGHSASK